MRFFGAYWREYLKEKVFIISIVAVLALAIVLPAGTAETPGDPKRVAFDAVDLNKEMMDKYRPAMRKFYLNKKAQFK